MLSCTWLSAAASPCFLCSFFWQTLDGESHLGREVQFQSSVAGSGSGGNAACKNDPYLLSQILIYEQSHRNYDHNCCVWNCLALIVSKYIISPRIYIFIFLVASVISQLKLHLQCISFTIAGLEPSQTSSCTAFPFGFNRPFIIITFHVSADLSSNWGGGRTATRQNRTAVPEMCHYWNPEMQCSAWCANNAASGLIFL